MKRTHAALLIVFAGLFGCDEPFPDSGDGGAPPSTATPDPCSAMTPPAWCMPSPLDGGAACNDGVPDGLCEVSGAEVESCDCSDCAMTARCLGTCLNDGYCTVGQTDADGGTLEDCTCEDCASKVAACAPPPVGCVLDCFCDPRTDDCTCADCTTDQYCVGCVDNGVCVPFEESCACADCVDDPSCQAPDAGADAGADAGPSCDAG